jgi:hypothetical protein
VTYAPPDPVLPAGRPPWRRTTAAAAILLVNVGMATGVQAALGRQLAANELATGQVGGASINVIMEDGWFGRETHGRDVWAWSKGESTLLLRLSGKQPATITLRFGVRGLGTRTVTARIGERAVWRGVVGEEAAFVKIADLALQPGRNAIVFQSDVPGVLESTGPEARALTFALYNPRVE